jgi:hypothetical protein
MRSWCDLLVLIQPCARFLQLRQGSLDLKAEDDLMNRDASECENALLTGVIGGMAGNRLVMLLQVLRKNIRIQ